MFGNNVTYFQREIAFFYVCLEKFAGYGEQFYRVMPSLSYCANEISKTPADRGAQPRCYMIVQKS